MGNLFLFGIFLGLGLFFILADVLRLPLLSTERAMLSVVLMWYKNSYSESCHRRYNKKTER